jgi:hypothetical protein
MKILKNYYQFYILNENSNFEISENEFNKLLNKYCFGYSDIFFRADVKNFNFIKISGNDIEYKETGNYRSSYINFLMDDWKNFPNRTKSIIFSNDYFTSKKHSNNRNMFSIYPYNGSNIGVCQEKDVLDPYVFKDENYLFYEFYREVETICDLKKLDFLNIKKQLNKSKSSFIETLNLLDSKLLYKLKEKSDPIKNNFKNFIMDWNNIPKLNYNELWTDGTCLMKMIINDNK